MKCFLNGNSRTENGKVKQNQYVFRHIIYSHKNKFVYFDEKALTLDTLIDFNNLNIE